MTAPAIPLSRWANAELRKLAAATGSAKIAALDGATLLGERAALNGFHIPGLRSAGGGCRLFQTRDGWIALNLSRPDDRALMPALFEDDVLDPDDDEAIARRLTAAGEAELVARGREMGLAIAGVNERRRGPKSARTTTGIERPPPLHRPPLVIDLSALWAGPLAGHLLWLAGAEVVKVESRNRPDSMREGDPQLFARLNQGKASLQVDLRDNEDREALIALIRRADMVIEAARPRALLQLGIDADKLVREVPGLIWMTITGHGTAEDAAQWVGFGDDCGVAGRLSAAMLTATDMPAFVGDAIADPLTGITVAHYGWGCWRGKVAGRLTFSMRDVVSEALREERERDAAGLEEALRQWGRSVGQPFPPISHREAGPVRPLGADTAAWLGGVGRC
jgi:hypothetical protein